MQLPLDCSAAIYACLRLRARRLAAIPLAAIPLAAIPLAAIPARRLAGAPRAGWIRAAGRSTPATDDRQTGSRPGPACRGDDDAYPRLPGLDSRLSGIDSIV